MNLDDDHPIAVSSRLRRAAYSRERFDEKLEVALQTKIRKSRRTGSTRRGVFDSFTRALVRACAKRPPSSKAKRRALIKKAGGVRALFEQQAGIL